MRRAYVLGVLSALVAASVWAETPTDDYTFRYSTLDRVGELAVRPTSEATGLSFKLNAETFDKAIGLGAAGGPAGETVTEWRPVAFVPPKVTVTAISVAIPGSDAPAFITVTPSVAEGETATSVQFDLDTNAAETVSLVGADGIAHTATLRTYKNATGVTLTPDQVCAFSFDDSQTGTAIRNFYTIGNAPHLRVTGTATITRHVLNISDGGKHSFATLAGFDESMDQADQVFVVEFSGSGGTLQMDAPLQNAPLVIGSSVSSTEAAVSFDSAFTVPLSLRDGEGGEGGLSLTFGEGASFNPSALLLACDVTLKSPVNLPEEAWLATHDVPIPADRTFRLELASPVDSEDNLPNLSFADATSRLELASNAIGTDGNPLGIPAKYQKMLNTQSGTLVLDRNVTASSGAFYATAQNLDFTLILTGDHTFDFGALFTADDWSESGQPSNFRSFTLIQESGKSSFGSQFSLYATERNIIRVEGGTSTIGSMLGFPANSTTVLDIEKDATLTLDDLAVGTATGDGSGALDLTVRGTLNLTGDVSMTPAARRTLRVEDGTIHATSTAAITCADGGASTAEDYLTVSGGGTLSGSLTVDSVTGNGTLKIGEGATVTTLYAYNGTIEGTGMIGTFTGDLGDVTLGDDWLTSAGKTLADVVAKAQNYHGTLGFTAGEDGKPKEIDFASVQELTELPGAFRAANYQHVTMRLDQYIDATIRWPDDPQGITLTLIESGAYGGEAEIPAVPADVTFEFKYYNAAGGLVKREEGDDYRRDPSEDGVTDELTWENAVFTGQGAWIDVEFDKVGETYTSANTGWFNLGTQNGCLVGLPNAEDNASGSYFDDYGKVTTDSTRFKPMGHPVSGGMILGYRPYVAPAALPSFPEEWSLAVRLTAPDKENACILAIGNNFDDKTASDNTYALVFATGAVEADGTTEIVLWKFDGRKDDGAALGEDAQDDLFRVKVADAKSAPHVFSVVCDGETLNLYMDGAWLDAIDVPDQTLSGGLQVGQQLGGSATPSDIRGKGGNVMPSDGGAVDYIRFYKGAFPDAAMVEMADRTPYVRENLRYVRTVPAANPPEGGETWIQKDAWLEQQWDGTKWTDKHLVDQPAEGAECRILVAAGEHPLQVNVERQVTGETDGDGQAVPAEHYFYSPNRTYASLVVRAQDEAASAATLRLVPLGVTKQESDDTDTTRPWESQLTRSDWFTTTEESSPGNRTGFRYGTLRFTGGVNDPINDEENAIADFHGAAYLLDAAVSGKGMNGIFDAGVCYLSKYAQVVLEGDSLQSTLTMVAGMSLTRGMVDEVARWQLTGPVVLPDEATSADHVLGHGGLPEEDGQDSKDVWVPVFAAGSTWKFYDDTRVEGGEGNANGALTGLFARGVQTPGRLYLDFTVGVGTDDAPGTAEDTDKSNTGNFSEQAWYRYGYEANQTTSTLSGMKPVRAKPEDFDQAVAFQIRLSKKTGDVTLTLDEVPKARVQTFYVEEAEGTSGAPLALTLVTADDTLETADGATPLTVWQRVVAAARLDVSNGGKGNALNLIPEPGRHTPVHRGKSDRGAYVVGPMTVDWNFGAESSVPRLEVAKNCVLTFTAGQDFRRYDTTVAAQEGAYIHHTSNEPFQGQDVELAEGATFGFHATAASASTTREEGVVLEGSLNLLGSATLRAEGGSGNRLPRFFAAGGIVAEPLVSAESEEGQSGAIELIVDAAKADAIWRSRTAALTGDVPFGLRKTGPGTVTFDAETPPSVSGFVSVDEGTLNVTAAADTPVGVRGLHVEADATLADSGRMAGESRRLAIVPGGQTLSGGGTVDGVLRLESDATYVAAQGEYLTVTGGIDVGDGGTADINVTLPTGTTEGGEAYVGDTPYLVSGREERNVRRRLRPTLNGARWDAIAWLQDRQTFYAARKPALPVPGDFEGDQATNDWHPGFESLMVNQYQSLGHAYVGATQGRTRAGTARLSASQVNDALYAFSGISAFAPSDGAETGGRTYIDAHNFFVAYEFGISRMAFATIGNDECVVVEVKVRNALAESFGEAVAAAAAEGAAAFRTNTKITFKAMKGGQAQDLPKAVTVTEVANLNGDAGAASGDTRYFAMPYEALKTAFGTAPILLRPSATNPVELGAQ